MDSVGQKARRSPEKGCGEDEEYQKSKKMGREKKSVSKDKGYLIDCQHKFGGKGLEKLDFSTESSMGREGVSMAKPHRRTKKILERSQFPNSFLEFLK